MADFDCPYDGKSCAEFLNAVLSYQQHIERLSKENSPLLFLDPGNWFGKECPLDATEQIKCTRYQKWVKENQNAR